MGIGLSQVYPTCQIVKTWLKMLDVITSDLVVKGVKYVNILSVLIQFYLGVIFKPSTDCHL